MKTKTSLMALGALMLIAAIIAISCTSTPTRLETKLFDIQTNYVDAVILRTNVIWTTNTFTVTKTVTNENNVVVPVFVTNAIPVPLYSVTTITQQVPTYVFSQGTNAQGVKDTAAAIGNIAMPGVGGPIAGGVAGLILAGWQWFRNRKSTAAAASGVQAVEVARNLVKSLPNGATYDAAYVQWLQRHQVELGVLPQVLDLMKTTLDTNSTRQTTDQIKAAVAAATKP